MIELSSIALLSLLGGVAAAPAVFVTSRLQRWVGRRRNQRGLCRACSRRLYEDASGPFRIHGVLFCARCAEHVRLTMTAGLWVAAGAGLLLPLLVGLGMAGVLPFVTGGITAGAIAGLIVPPIVLTGVVGIELRQARRANARAELEEREAGPRLGPGSDRHHRKPSS